MIKNFNARDVEIYIGFIDSSDFDIGARGNNVTIAKYIADAVDAGDILNFKKLSETHNEISVEPSEDDVSTRKYFGLNSNMVQNSATTRTINPDVDVTLTADADVVDTLIGYGLNQDSLTHSGVDDYRSFILANVNDDTKIILFRVRKRIAGVYYYRNVALVNPFIQKNGEFTGNVDDEVFGSEVTFLGNKSYCFYDDYNSVTDEDVDLVGSYT